MYNKDSFINEFDKNQTLIVAVLLNIITDLFDKKNNFQVLVEVRENQLNFLDIDVLKVNEYIENIELDKIKNAFKEFNSAQKDLLVYLSIELLNYEKGKVSDFNYSVTLDLFDKIANINPEEYNDRVDKIVDLLNAFSKGKEKKEKDIESLRLAFEKNPHLKRAHLGTLIKEEKKCYVATLAYGDINHPKVEQFRVFRDLYLSNNFFGRMFIKTYYKYSPRIVKLLTPYKNLNILIRVVLDCILKLISNKIK